MALDQHSIDADVRRAVAKHRNWKTTASNIHQRERARQAYQWQDGAEGGLAQIERAAHREYVEQLRDERARKTLI